MTIESVMRSNKLGKGVVYKNMKQERYTVTGMSCAACSARVEKAVSAVPGVSSCSVNLLTNSMTVEGTADKKMIADAVSKAGYGLGGADKKSESETDMQTKKLRKRLLYSLGFSVVLMYVSMGHTMWGLPLPNVLAENILALGITQMLLAIIVMVINQKFFVNGFKGLINRAPNMDTLVALGSGASFVYSVYALFAMSGAVIQGNMAAAHSYVHELYFESAAMILALITLGKMLESRSKGKTADALKGLMDLAPKTAIILSDGEEKEIPISEIKKGDIFLVKSGESIPADGVIVDGHCAVDESALTGESIPVDKTVGGRVSAATINQAGFIKCEVVKAGEETLISQIIKMVSDASATKAPAAKAADKISGIFVPTVMVLAVLTMLIWIVCGKTVGFALARGISVLVISCPCALGLATPVAIMVGNGIGAKNGILFKNASALEEAGKTRIVVLDKTGTITEGKPEVTDIFSHTDEVELMQCAYSLEAKSSHPLAVAVVNKANGMNLNFSEVTDFRERAGNGLSGMIKGVPIRGGNRAFIQEVARIPNEMLNIAEKAAAEGKTPLYFAKGDVFLGIIAVADAVKTDSPRAVAELKKMGLRVVMLTGDNERTANAVKLKSGVDEVIAGVKPNEKANVVADLKKQGRVMMVGDGINDAPALTTADVGTAIGSGTDIAIDAADIVLMKSTLADVPAAIRLSRATLKNIYENLFWAFIYNVVGIPIAAGALIPIWGIRLNPMFGAAAMSLSSFFVVSNALRLNLKNIYSDKKDYKIKNKKEKSKMEKTMKIEGMMCGHCEARVKKVLEGIDGVSEAVVSHEENSAKLTLEKAVSDEILKKSIEDEGYTVTEIL